MANDRENRWLIGLAVVFAVACSAFGLWLWCLILGRAAL